ncbi:MAG: galactose mutarotase [Propionibacteriaceae bacterium]|jgi:aldose 1-epimerase|nr:galactose mutarotase [Propionibacteriaceae bacterium]
MEKVILGRGDFTVEVWNRGACVNDVRMPDRDGRVESVLLGYATDADRVAGEGYLGEIVGPFANRIAGGGYVVDGRQFTPDLNDSGTSTLHGGSHGWSSDLWQMTQANDLSVAFHLDWTDPTGGFAGPIHVDVAYQLAGRELTHTVTATCDEPTVISVVSHPYFNLSGKAQPIRDHELMVAASRYLPIDDASIPTAEAPATVAGTPFDFRAATELSAALDQSDPQLSAHGGIDHALILDEPQDQPSATLSHRDSGRRLEIFTDYPALQVYTGQFLNDPRLDHPRGAGRAMNGIALETEEYPDAPRRPDFPSCVLRPGETYVRHTTWRFSIFN